MFRHSWRQILLYTSITVIVNIFFYFFYIFRFNSNLGFRSPSTVYYNNKFRFYSCFLLISKKIIRRPRGHRFPALTNSRFFATFVNLSLKIQQKTTEIRIFFDKIDKDLRKCQFSQCFHPKTLTGLTNFSFLVNFVNAGGDVGDCLTDSMPANSCQPLTATH